MRRITRGFTIIELLVVVSVIGVLATITLIGFNRYQADSRDSQRSSQATIIAEALEKYYDKNGEYPSCSVMTDTASNIVSNTLIGTDPKVFITPQADSSQTNSIDFCNDLTTGTPTDSFAYVGDGSGTCSTGNSCLQYSLQYKEESTNTIKTIASRRQTSVCASSDITNLAATTFSFSQVNLTWSVVGGATSYNVQRATNSSFTTGMVQTTSSTNSASITGLTLGTLYYFRVQPASTTASCNWSNTSSATTYTLDTPSGSATPNSVSQITYTWNSVANATSYAVDYSTSSTFATVPSGTTLSIPTATSPLVRTTKPDGTPITAGTTLYFRVKAAAATYTSGWSNTSSATTTVPVPTNLIATTNSATQITASWDTVSVATSYTLDYSLSSSFTSPTSITGITGVSQAVTGLLQGRTYYFRVYALVSSTSSTASSTASATTTVNAPGTPGVGVAMGGTRPYAAGRWIAWINSPASGNWYYAQGWASTSCGGGASPQYLMGANYNSPGTFYGWAGWDSDSTYYMVRPNSGYSIRFSSVARCVSSQGVASGNSGQGYSGYLGP